jgi:hypothetical protein
MAMENKIKFAMGTPQAFTIASWEQTQFGMKYNTSDGRFFDASKGLTDLLTELALVPNTQVTIEKRSNPPSNSSGQDYGKFYVNNQSIDDIRNGGVLNQTVNPAPQVAVNQQPSAGHNVESGLEGRVATLEARLKVLEDKSLPF